MVTGSGSASDCVWRDGWTYLGRLEVREERVPWLELLLRASAVWVRNPNIVRVRWLLEQQLETYQAERLHGAGPAVELVQQLLGFRRAQDVADAMHGGGAKGAAVARRVHRGSPSPRGFSCGRRFIMQRARGWRFSLICPPWDEMSGRGRLESLPLCDAKEISVLSPAQENIYSRASEMNIMKTEGTCSQWSTSEIVGPYRFLEARC